MELEQTRALLQILSLRPDVVEWNRNTFPDWTEYQQLVKFNNEFGEMINEGTELTDGLLYELADCFISAFGMFRYNRKMSNSMIETVLKYTNDKALLLLPEYVKKKFELIQKRKYDKNGQHIEV